jgi:sugar/nucleoside kinase (ribokinase family)
MLFSDAGVFIVPAYPLENVADPTGAGDTFAGALMGSLARDGEVTDETLRHAMLYGSTVASFGVEEFSLDRLRRLTEDQIEARAAELADMMRFELD